MKNFKKYISIISFFILLSFLTNCKQDLKTEMIFTTEKTDSLKIGLSGSWGRAIINWGDDSKDKTSELWSLPIYFEKNYSDKKIHTIKINGSELNTITGLSCFNNQITNIDVSNNPKLKSLEVLRNNLTDLNISKNTELTELNCTWNKLKKLDVNNNKNLQNLSCENNQLKNLNLNNNEKLVSVFLRSNQLNSEQLDSLFESLHNNKIWGKTIYIGGNPGAKKCNKSIAIKKGWTIDTEPVEFK